MDKCVVVAIGNSQARFFTLEQAEWPEYESGPNLVEQEVLSHSELNYSNRLWSKITQKYAQDLKTADRSHYKFERRFAEKITGEIINLIRIHQGQKLILIAQPPILKLIRKLFTPTLFHNLQIKELSKDLHHFNTSQIHQYLARKQLIPACQTVVYPR